MSAALPVSALTQTRLGRRLGRSQSALSLWPRHAAFRVWWAREVERAGIALLRAGEPTGAVLVRAHCALALFVDDHEVVAAVLGSLAGVAERLRQTAEMASTVSAGSSVCK